MPDRVDTVIAEMRDRAAIGLNTLILRDWADRLSVSCGGTEAERFAVENTELDRAVREKIDRLKAAGGTAPEPSEEARDAAQRALRHRVGYSEFGDQEEARAEDLKLIGVMLRAAYKTDFGGGQGGREEGEK